MMPWELLSKQQDEGALVKQENWSSLFVTHTQVRFSGAKEIDSVEQSHFLKKKVDP